MKPLLTTALALTLSGCVMNGIPVTDTDFHTDRVDKVFVGVPFLLAIEGSAVEIAGGVYLTVAHNRAIYALRSGEWLENEVCDIALYVESDASWNNPIDFGYVYQDGTTYATGYPGYMPKASTVGFYVGDVKLPNDDCMYSASSNTVASGMSGGGVFNEHGELVGIISAVGKDASWPDGRTMDAPLLFVSLNAVKDWIEIQTGIEL